MSMAVGMYTSGVNVYKMNELCSSVGILSPSLTGMYKNNTLAKKDIMDVSREQLKQNRQEHVSYICNTSDYIGDVKATIDNVTCMVSCGKIAMDGAGNARAYNHLIRGSQHCLILYSLAIMKSIIVVGH